MSELFGFVSDERYVALADVAIEFENARGDAYEARSRASGAIRVDLPPGEYLATLQKPGFGSKRERVVAGTGRPHHFRLLADGLLGYAWPKAVRSGEASEFRVHSVEPYHLELWRYGWDKERLAGLGWHDEHGPRATMQITPDGDYTQSGVEWNRVGYASPHHRQTVVAPARSGLHYFHARTATGRAFAFPWIVAPARPTAPLAVLASNLTWNAYNAFGGRSNYIHADGLPARPPVNSRQEIKRYVDPEHQSWGAESYPPLAFDRPEPINDIALSERIDDPIEGRSACHVAPAEWRLLGWLEREGFPYDLYAETQLDDGTLDLDRYQALALGPHPEYWTRRMYDRVKAWVFAGKGRLAYLGGNGLNCEVEILPGDRMVCRNTKIASLWPAGMGGAESRFARRHESEANLLGVVFTPAGMMTGAPYRVVDGDHPLMRAAGLKTGDLFGTRSLHRRCPGGASGHETDKRSPSSPPGVRLLAQGLNADGGGAEIVHFTTPSGGEVFSVGSICYASSLPIDAGVSALTRAALERILS